MRGGAWAPASATGAACGLFWFMTFALWSSEYRVSIRGTATPASCASLMGDPRYVSISIGLRAVKS